MDDLVYRRMAIDAFADYIHNMDKVIGTGRLSAYDCKNAATNVLAGVLPAQPEIIKCEECMWWDRGNCYSEDVYVESLEYMDGDLRTEPDHFCGYAKRRTDDKRRGN